MIVQLPKAHLEICENVIAELNKSAKKGIKKVKLNINKYAKDILNKNLTIEEKKHLLLLNLHKLLVLTFSINPDKLSKKNTRELKEKLPILRNTILKLRDINYYLKAISLKELKLTKNAEKDIKKTRLSDILEEDEGYLPLDYIERLEAIVYHLISKTIYFDKNLIARYKKSEIKLLNKSEMLSLELNDIIARQSGILCHIEAKLPPANKLSVKLLTKKIFTEWVSRIFALLTALEYEYKNECVLFAQLRKNKKIARRLSLKIERLTKEKFTLLRLKEKRLLETKNQKVIEDMHHICAHNYSAVLKL